MTTSKGSGASARPAPHKIDPTATAKGSLLKTLRKRGEHFFGSVFSFPLLFILLLVDQRLPVAAAGIFSLLFLLALASVCAEEYTSFLRRKGFRVPSALGLNAAAVPLLIAFCWRPNAQEFKVALQLSENGLALWLLTVVTLAAVFGTLMVALSLVSEVSEKLLTGLSVFLLACGGALLIGAAFAHLLLLEQLTPGSPWNAVIALVGGWLFAILAAVKAPFPALPVFSRFVGLAIFAVVVFWVCYPRFI